MPYFIGANAVIGLLNDATTEARPSRHPGREWNANRPIRLADCGTGEGAARGWVTDAA
jgi:hypothetical protein